MQQFTLMILIHYTNICKNGFTNISAFNWKQQLTFMDVHAITAMQQFKKGLLAIAHLI